MLGLALRGDYEYLKVSDRTQNADGVLWSAIIYTVIAVLCGLYILYAQKVRDRKVSERMGCFREIQLTPIEFEAANDESDEEGEDKSLLSKKNM